MSSGRQPCKLSRRGLRRQVSARWPKLDQCREQLRQAVAAGEKYVAVVEVSRGASCNLELEIDSDLVNDAGRLQGQIRRLFDMAKMAVEEELNGDSQSKTGARNNGPKRRRPSRPATQSQVRAIRAIADRQRVDLPELLRSRFQTDQACELSIREASSLIDELKQNGNGRGGRR